jgi:hypothetical protein
MALNVLTASIALAIFAFLAFSFAIFNTIKMQRNIRQVPIGVTAVLATAGAIGLFLNTVG